MRTSSNTSNIITTDNDHISKIRSGQIIHPSSIKSNLTTSKIPTSPNTKLKRRRRKVEKPMDIIASDEKDEKIKEVERPSINPVSSIAIVTNIFQENDNEDRKSEHKSKFLDDIHNIKVNDPPAGLKRIDEPRPPMFFAWADVNSQDKVLNLANVMSKSAPYALDDIDVDKTSKKFLWQTEYREMYSSLSSTFYSSYKSENNMIVEEVKLNSPSGKKAKPIEIDGAGVSSRVAKVPSVIIPSFFAWKTDHYLERDETDIGGKRVNIKPPDSPHHVIVKDEVTIDETSKLDSEYKNMFINAPEDFVPRVNIIRREPKSPIVLFTEYKPISELQDKEFIPFHIHRPCAPIPTQIHFENEQILSKPKKDIVISNIEQARDYFIPIDIIDKKDEDDEWILVDSNPIISNESTIKLVTPSKQIDTTKHQAKKQKILNPRKKKEMGSITLTSFMTPQQFVEVSRSKSPNKNILSSEYDSKFINHFANGGNFTLVEKKKKPVPPKRKSSVAFGTSINK